MKMELHIHDDKSHQFGNIEIGDWFQAHDFLWMKIKSSDLGNSICLNADTENLAGAHGTFTQNEVVTPVAKVEITLV